MKLSSIAFNNKFDRATADIAVFNSLMIALAEINENSKGFTAIRAI